MAGETPDPSNAELERIRARIAGLVEQWFAASGEPYYLSKLGAELGPDRLLLERLTRQKLSQFVQQQFEFRIGKTGEHLNILYIVPPIGTGTVLVPPAPKRAIPRYKSRFWAAFARPLVEGERRFIDIDTLVFGSDEAKLKEGAANVREIGADFVAPYNASPAEIAGRIEQWLQLQGLDRTPFLLQPRKSSNVRSTLLKQLLEALDGEQLKRVSVPLDIIRTLNEREAP